MVTRSVLALAALAIAASSLSACSTGDSPSALPAGVSIDVFLGRSSAPQRVLEISVLNDSPDPLTITGARFSSSQFQSVAEWTKKDSTTVRPGLRVNLPVPLADASCADVDPSHVVELEFTTAAGVEGTATVPAVDRLDRFPQLRIDDCLGETLARNATIAMADTVTPVIIAGNPAATLAITITPTAADGAVQLRSLRGTVLLNLVDGATGELVNELPIGETVNASSAPIELTVALEPQRCDPHVVAEDKRGTFLPMQVTTADGTEGTIYLEASASLRDSLYAFVASACGFANAGPP